MFKIKGRKFSNRVKIEKFFVLEFLYVWSVLILELIVGFF